MKSNSKLTPFNYGNVNNGIKRPKYYSFKDIDMLKEYNTNNDNVNFFKRRLKMPGQMKLFTVEVRFLTETIKIHELKNEYKFNLLYIGSAEGFHIPKLIELYRDIDIVWYFYDKNRHCEMLIDLSKKYPEKIKIFHQLFLDNDIEIFKTLSSIENRKLIFISDIRSVDEGEVNPNTNNLRFDYEIQNSILNQLSPDYSLIKYRMPFPDDWDKTYEINKPIGEEYLQPFLPPSSAEFRIAIGRNIMYEKITLEQLVEYEQKMSYYNSLRNIENFEQDLDIFFYVMKQFYNSKEKGKYNIRSDYNLKMREAIEVNNSFFKPISKLNFN